MDKLPFSVYDFFGYLSAGFILLCGLSAAFVGADLLNGAPSIIVSVLLVICAYIAGHTVANVSGYVLESQIVGRWLRNPTEHLFEPPVSGAVPPTRLRLFPGHHCALPSGTADRVLARASDFGIAAATDELFHHCHARVKAHPEVSARLDIFSALYGFARNTCVSLLIVTCALGVGIALGTADTGTIGPGWWAAGAGVGAIGMFYRYLKFFRQYRVELFTSYAEMS